MGVRVAIAILLLSTPTGCYRAHPVDRGDDGLSTPLDASRPDAPPPDPIDGGADGGADAGRDVGVDAPVDAGVCEGMFEERALHFCSFDPSGFIPAGETSTLSIWLASCGCPADRRCEVAVDAAARAVSIDTWSCPPITECTDCTNELGCMVPPLDEGDYALSVDGRYVATLPVRRSEPISLAHPFCVGLPSEGDPAICTGAPVPAVPLQVCHRALEDVGTFVTVDIHLACTAPCRSIGPCIATLDGSRVHVEVADRECDGTCTDCPTDRTARCATPPLRAGEYTIVVDTGAGPPLESALTVRDVTSPGPTRCFTSPR